MGRQYAVLPGEDHLQWEQMAAFGQNKIAHRISLNIVDNIGHDAPNMQVAVISDVNGLIIVIFRH